MLKYAKRLFVFIGVYEKKSAVDLEILMERLQENYTKKAIAIEFNRKGDLLLSNFNEVSFYITFLKSKNELEGFFELARNFELVVHKNPVTTESLHKRYNQIKKSSPNLYKELHFIVAISIFEEMQKLHDMQIFSFQ